MAAVVVRPNKESIGNESCCKAGCGQHVVPSRLTREEVPLRKGGIFRDFLQCASYPLQILDTKGIMSNRL
jgi:hypothetical protein